jgi:hypothetical protein
MMVTKLLEYNAPSVLENGQLSNIWHFSITFAILATSCFISIVAPGIKVVFGLTGATASVSLVFLMPGMFYLRVMKDSASPRDIQMARLYVFVGSIIGSVSLAGEVVSFFM